MHKLQPLNFTKTLLTLAVILVLSACGSKEQSDGIETSTDNGNRIENIQVVSANPVKSFLREEEFPLPNCGGTRPFTIKLGSNHSIGESVTVDTTATVGGSAGVDIPTVVKVQLEAEVQRSYENSRNAERSRIDSFEMSAAEGTHVVYVIEWEEQKFASAVSYTMGGQLASTEYEYLLTIPKAIDSFQVNCPTATPTITLTPTITPTPTNTYTPTPVPQASVLIIVFWDENGNGIIDAGGDRPILDPPPVIRISKGGCPSSGSPSPSNLLKEQRSLLGGVRFVNLEGGSYCVEVVESSVVRIGCNPVQTIPEKSKGKTIGLFTDEKRDNPADYFAFTCSQ